MKVTEKAVKKIKKESTFTIEKEFQELIPVHTESELVLLKDSIAKNGLLHPLIIWKEENILLDGHTRNKIAEELNIHLDNSHFQYLSFKDKVEAKDWIRRNQFARRNLNKYQKAYIIGKKYLEEKGEKKYIKSATNNAIAELFKVNEKTVRRAGNFALGLDNLSSFNLANKTEVLNGLSGMKKEVIEKCAKVKTKEQAEGIIDPKKETREVDFNQTYKMISGIFKKELSNQNIEEIQKTLNDPIVLENGKKYKISISEV
jgi:hypothetical protein